MKETYANIGLLAAAAAYITLAPALILMDSDGPYLLRMIAVGAFNALLTALIATAILSLGIAHARKFLYAVFSLYFIVYALATFYFILVYHQMVGVPMASAILDSTPTEAGEYFRALFKPFSIVRAIYRTHRRA